MSSFRRLGGLALLARSPCAGVAAAVPTAGLMNDGHGALGWAGSLHSAGFLGPVPPPCPAQSRRHNSTHAGPLDDLPAASASPSTSATSACACASSPATDSPLPTTLAADWATAPPAAALADASLSPPLAALACPSASCCPSSSFPLAAASPLDDSLALFLSPTQLGVQLWEGAHSASGMPWWAAIPATGLALRAALLPLSLRAYAASTNVALLHQAFGLSRAVAEAVVDATERQQQQKQQQQQAGEGLGAGRRDEREAGAQQQPLASSSGAGGAGGAAAVAVGPMGLRRLDLDLVRRVFAQLRVRHEAPSFGWYVGNAAVQVPLAVSLSLALRRMSDSLWPGLTGEGALYFPDLTAPPMYLQTLSTPYGTAGAILPLALVLLYVSAVDKSAGASSPGIHMALKLLVLPLYCGALMQPHAVLLYWLALATSQLGVYGLAARLPPALRRAAGVPDVLLGQGQGQGQGASPASAGAGAGEGQAKDTAVVDELLLALSESYGKSGNTAAARACLEALLVRQPDNEAAAERLRALPPSPVDN